MQLLKSGDHVLFKIIYYNANNDKMTEEYAAIDTSTLNIENYMTEAAKIAAEWLKEIFEEDDIVWLKSIEEMQIIVATTWCLTEDEVKNFKDD